RGTQKMISRKIRFITAATVLALLASVAVARTVHTHAPTTASQATSGKVTGTPTNQSASPHRHGVIVCGMANDSDCEKLEMLLPMSRAHAILLVTTVQQYRALPCHDP